MNSTSGYPPIAEHGLIGDLHTAALVATDGTIDWFCAPRFDSPSVFASILDSVRGGCFSITATDESMVHKQMYLPDTAVLVTRYLGDSGVAEVTDFMPVAPSTHATDQRRLVRVIRGVRGSVTLAVRVQPRFDFGRQSHQTTIDGRHASFVTDELTLDLSANVDLQADGDDVRAEVEVAAGDLVCFVLESGAEHLTAIGHGEIAALIVETHTFWQRWVDQGTYAVGGARWSTDRRSR